MIDERRGKDESGVDGLCKLLYRTTVSEWCVNEATQDESEKREEVKGKGKGKGKVEVKEKKEEKLAAALLAVAEKHAVPMYLLSAMQCWCDNSLVPAPAIGPLG
jgi:hypothetical protein